MIIVQLQSDIIFISNKEDVVNFTILYWSLI